MFGRLSTWLFLCISRLGSECLLGIIEIPFLFNSTSSSDKYTVTESLTSTCDGKALEVSLLLLRVGHLLLLDLPHVVAHVFLGLRLEHQLLLAK